MSTFDRKSCRLYDIHERRKKKKIILYIVRYNWNWLIKLSYRKLIETTIWRKCEAERVYDHLGTSSIKNLSLKLLISCVQGVWRYSPLFVPRRVHEQQVSWEIPVLDGNVLDVWHNSTPVWVYIYNFSRL